MKLVLYFMPEYRDQILNFIFDGLRKFILINIDEIDLENELRQEIETILRENSFWSIRREVYFAGFYGESLKSRLMVHDNVLYLSSTYLERPLELMLPEIFHELVHVSCVNKNQIIVQRIIDEEFKAFYLETSLWEAWTNRFQDYTSFSKPYNNMAEAWYYFGEKQLERFEKIRHEIFKNKDMLLSETAPHYEIIEGSISRINKISNSQEIEKLLWRMILFRFQN
jgi:hypothetical protein